MNDVGPVMDRPDVMHAKSREELPRDLEPAERIVEHVPLMRVAGSQRVRAEEHRRRHAPGPIERERIHRLQDAVLDCVEKLEVTDHVLCTERLEGEFAAGLLHDAVAPGFKNVEADAAGPRRLDLPGRGLALSRGDVKAQTSARGSRAGADDRGLLEKGPPGIDDALYGFTVLLVCCHGFSPLFLSDQSPIRVGTRAALS